ncbi:MAG: hypothetical protein ACPLRJ_00770 [Infirmifilum uzonense]|uniref:hypothetical protein n=1 Tax=Infirmifilum uzonense TaxID=1550241 RepID=UPI003C75C680
MSVIKIVLWALDFTPNNHVQETLSKQVGDEVVFVGVGALTTAEEIISAMTDLKAEEVVTAIEDPCEMHKLLDRGVQPLVAIIEEVCRAEIREECKGYNPNTDVLVERGEGVVALRIREFARVIDIMFQLVDPQEKHVHEHEED